MFARLSSYQGSPIPEAGDIERSSREVLRQVQDLPGFRGMYLLVDRASGKSKSLTLWEDGPSMWESEARASDIRSQAAQREGEQVVSVERFEVGFVHIEA